MYVVVMYVGCTTGETTARSVTETGIQAEFRAPKRLKLRQILSRQILAWQIVA
jgi:hypothetical protein